MRHVRRRPVGQRAPRALLVIGACIVAVSLQAVRGAHAAPRHGAVAVPRPPSPPGAAPPSAPGPPVAPAPAPPPGGKGTTKGPGDSSGYVPTGAAGSKGGRATGNSSTGAAGSRPGVYAGRSHGATTGYGGFDPLSGVPDAWEQWWHDNEDRYLDLRSQLTGDAHSSGTQAPLTGRGRPSAAPGRRASDAVVERDILPVLFDQLGRSDEPEILDSALIALGRCVPDEEAETLLRAAQPMLAHRSLSVQTSAVLALGIQGSPRYVPLLGHLMSDSAAGRAAVGGGEVPAPVRAIAALAVGLGNHEAGVPMLADLVLHLPDAESDLKVCALTALGLTSNAAGNEALGVLLGLLADRRLDSRIKAHVPLAMARLDGGTHAEAVPALLTALAHKDTDDVVRTSCAMALGRLASAADAGAIELLVQAVTKARQERTRHAALVGLAEIGRRDRPDEAAHSALHARLAQVLAAALEDATSPSDRAWAALAIGVYVRDGAARGPELVGRLQETYRSQRDPSARGACALALGLAGATDVVPELVSDFREAGDEGLRGHAAVALGLLDSQGARDEMLACCADKSAAPGLREQVAVGLALLGTHEVVTELIGVLERYEVHPVSVSAARALGRIGDRAAIEPLAQLAGTGERQPSTRGMACVALGLLGERGALPWNAPLKELRLQDASFPMLDLVLDIL